MIKKIRYLMAFGFLLSFFSLSSAIFFDVGYLGKLVFFFALFLIVMPGMILTFSAKVEIKGKPATAGMKTATIGFLVLMIGVAMVFGVSSLGGIGFMLASVGIVTMLIGIIIQVSYFF